MQRIEFFRTTDATRAVPAGEYIFQAGESSDSAFVLVEGQAVVLVNGQVVEEAGPGTLLGEMALVEGRPRSASAQAVTECRLVAIDERRFTFLIQQHPFFAIQVMRIMAERLRRMNEVLSAAPERAG
jgi:CRP-like cAMP-binding protein